MTTAVNFLRLSLRSCSDIYSKRWHQWQIVAEGDSRVHEVENDDRERERERIQGQCCNQLRLCNISDDNTCSDNIFILLKTSIKKIILTSAVIFNTCLLIIYFV